MRSEIFLYWGTRCGDKFGFVYLIVSMFNHVNHQGKEISLACGLAPTCVQLFIESMEVIYK